MQHFDRLFRAAEVEAEALIGIARMLVATILGLAAFILIQRGGMPTDPNTQLEVYHSLIVLGCYFTLGLISVSIVKLGLYRTWIAWILAVAEVFLIALNIYSDVISAGSELLSPPCRPRRAICSACFWSCKPCGTDSSFRSRHRCCLSAQLLRSCCSLPVAEPCRMRKHLPYLTSNYSGIPNFVRVIMLILVIGIAALSVWRGRKLIHDIANEVEVRANQKRFLPGELAEPDDQCGYHAPARRDGFANLVIMFVDIRGFTTLVGIIRTRRDQRIPQRISVPDHPCCRGS